jgi:hypothetical protein
MEQQPLCKRPSMQSVTQPSWRSSALDGCDAAIQCAAIY